MNEYSVFDEFWKKTCKIIFEKDFSTIVDFKQYLVEGGADPIVTKQSGLSGNSVYMVKSEYLCSKARFISNNEREEYWDYIKKIKLDYNDFDSLVEGLKKHIFYAGNIILGNCGNITKSNKIVNSQHVLESTVIQNSRYVAFSTTIFGSHYIFGVNGAVDSNFVIGGFDNVSCNRVFEIFSCQNVSDSLYCGNMVGCTNCMFSFNQRNKEYVVGNNQLGRKEYFEIKTRLLSEIKNELDDKKQIFRICDIMGGKNE
ncbi:hypothetical protein KO465_05000 [Candidatus Micrarchaeota archaeon]|nr:hypothetical protein [Candidatus Micrarchaeota archaeon]